LFPTQKIIILFWLKKIRLTSELRNDRLEAFSIFPEEEN
jgi:hypothetical protein